MTAAAQATPPACYADVRSYYAGRAADGKLRLHVFTAHGYAIVPWSTRHTGGEGIFRLRNGKWCLIADGGGIVDDNGLVSYGVPRDVAQQLMAQLAVAR